MKATGHKKVVFALPAGLVVGGANTWSFRLAEKLATRGWIPVLVEHAPDHGQKRVTPDKSIQNLICPVGGGALTQCSRRQLKKMSSQYEQLLPAVLVPNVSEKIFVIAAKLTRQVAERIRVVAVCHAVSNEFYNVLTRYESIIHQFVAVSEESAAHLEQCLPLRRDDITYLPTAVDVPMDVSARTLRKDHVVLTYAGRITNHEKCVGLLLELAQHLERNQCPFILNIVGDGGLKKYLRDSLDKESSVLKSNVRLYDACTPSKMRQFWENTDFVVLTSERESFGLSLLEGMSYGCVPVATACSGPSSIINDNVSGILSPIHNMEHMAKRIQALVKDAEAYQIMSAAAINRAKQYSLEKYTSDFISICTRAWLQAPRQGHIKKNIFQSL